MIKRALISVSDKRGIVEFANQLSKLGIEILSTGGTAQLLRDSGIAAIDVSDVTGFPECLDGRVKTLHPVIHGGILAMRSNPHHMETIEKLDIKPIDMVIINLYPFKETISKPDVTLEDAVENIDIGGPTIRCTHPYFLLRKYSLTNFSTFICSPNPHTIFILKRIGGLIIDENKV